MRPDFTRISYNLRPQKSMSGAQKEDSTLWMTSEGVAVKHLYTAEDLAGMKHLEYAAGIPPFLRGP